MNLNLILGDSTSTTIGGGTVSYPNLLSQNKIWPNGTTLINCSLPGLTSADLCTIFFKDFNNKIKEISNVIIYVGNCDAASSEVQKGKHTKFIENKYKIFRKFGREPKKISLKNKLLFFEWNKNIDTMLEKSERPEDYAYNIQRIVDVCKKSKTNLILVKPIANKKFPPGLGKGNFIFYHYFGLNDKSSSALEIKDRRFVDGYKLFEEGKYKDASEVYASILADFDVNTCGNEYTQVLINNYAIAQANLYAFDEAIYLLKILLEEKNVRSEIIYYNIAQLFLKKGDTEAFKFYIEKSYDLDSSMYRIRKPYWEALDVLIKKNPNINVIDLYKLCPENVFLDHCHLLPKGHILLAEAIKNQLTFDKKFNTSKANLINKLYNPEVAKGNNSDFFDYFKAIPDIDRDFIKKNVTQLNSLLFSTNSKNLSKTQLNSFSTEFREAFKYYKRHPLFYNDTQLLNEPPTRSSDIGRFPEFFLVRLMIPYMIEYEKITDQKKLYSSNFPGLISSQQLLKILPEKCREIKFETPYWINGDKNKTELKNLIDNIKKYIHNSILQGNMINLRLKSTIFWYVRECLRLGGHSRISMLYDFVNLQFISEAIIVAYLANINSGFSFSTEIYSLASKTEKLIKCHEKFCSEYITDTDKFDHNAYDITIKKFANLINK